MKLCLAVCVCVCVCVCVYVYRCMYIYPYISPQHVCICINMLLSLLERWQARYFAWRNLHQSPASSWVQKISEALIGDGGNTSPDHSIIGVYNIDTKRVEWREVFGIPMVCASSPWNFCRIPVATCVIAQCWTGVVVDRYMDDFLIVDVGNSPLKDRETGRVWASSAQ